MIRREREREMVAETYTKPKEVKNKDFNNFYM